MAQAPSSPLVARRLSGRLALVPAFGMITVPAIVLPAILWARWAFARLHPDADPAIYLTISRAISDPAIGEPFARWVTLAALILLPSTHFLLWMIIAEHPKRDLLGATRDRICRALFVAASASMIATCVGMIMLSHYRLGASGDYQMHMVGSYVFFIGQALTILLVAIYHALITPARRLTGDGAFFPALWRARVGFWVVGCAALYGVVFRIKSMDLGAAKLLVATIYVELDTILIGVFLAYLVLFVVDATRFARARVGVAAAATPTASEEPEAAFDAAS
jgi:hypothetical protein